MTMKLKVGDKLKEVRETRNLSQEEFAVMLGLSTSVYGRLERNETTPDMNQVVRFSELLKIPIQEFLPDTVTFQTHNDHGQIGCVFGTIYYYNSKEDTADKDLQKEIELLQEKLRHAEEKNRLLEEQIALLKNLLPGNGVV